MAIGDSGGNAAARHPVARPFVFRPGLTLPAGLITMLPRILGWASGPHSQPGYSALRSLH